MLYTPPQLSTGFAADVRFELERVTAHIVALHERYIQEGFYRNGTHPNGTHPKMQHNEIRADIFGASPLEHVHSRQLEPLMVPVEPHPEFQQEISIQNREVSNQEISIQNSIQTAETEEEHEKKSVMVKLACAYNLRDADNMCCMGSSDPYCICRIKGDESTEFRTITVNNNLNPIWNHVGYLSFDEEIPSDAELEFIVMDADYHKADDLLGKAWLSLSKCLPDGFQGTLKLLESGVDNALLKLSVDIIEDDTRSFLKLLAQSHLKWPYADAADSGCSSRRSSRISKSTNSAAFRGIVTWFDLQNLRMGDIMRGTGFMDRFVVSPGTRFRVYWEFLCFWIILYDLMMAPVTFAFDLDSKGMFIANLCITLFWTSDMVSTFLTGYTNNGVVELRFERVACRYIKSWFPLDFVIVLIDWFFVAIALIQETSGSNFLGRIGRILKVGRFARSTKMISLLRILKIKRNWVLSAIGSKPFSGILQAVSGIFFFTHIACCCFYGIGVYSSGETWLVAEGLDLESQSFPNQYFMAFEWALAQFTPSPVATHPTNLQERIFKIFVDFSGLLLFSNFIGAITAKITQMRTSRCQLVETENNLQRYFEENRVPMDLGNRVLEFIKQRNRHMSSLRIHESQIPALKSLPPRLLSELHIEIRLPHVLQHPFFVSLYGADAECVFSICDGMLEKNFLHDEEVFSRGASALGMYVIASGRVVYLKSGACQEIRNCQWLSEPALWIEAWRHRGDAVAVEAVETFVIDAATFRLLMDRRIPFEEQHEGTVSILISVYAASFVRDDLDTLDTPANMRHSDTWGSLGALIDVCDKARKAAGLSSSACKTTRSRLSKFLNQLRSDAAL